MTRLTPMNVQQAAKEVRSSLHRPEDTASTLQFSRRRLLNLRRWAFLPARITRSHSGALNCAPLKVFGLQHQDKICSLGIRAQYNGFDGQMRLRLQCLRGNQCREAKSGEQKTIRDHNLPPALFYSAFPYGLTRAVAELSGQARFFADVAVRPLAQLSSRTAKPELIPRSS